MLYIVPSAFAGIPWRGSRQRRNADCIPRWQLGGRSCRRSAKFERETPMCGLVDAATSGWSLRPGIRRRSQLAKCWSSASWPSSRSTRYKGASSPRCFNGSEPVVMAIPVTSRQPITPAVVGRSPEPAAVVSVSSNPPGRGGDGFSPAARGGRRARTVAWPYMIGSVSNYPR